MKKTRGFIVKIRIKTRSFYHTLTQHLTSQHNCGLFHLLPFCTFCDKNLFIWKTHLEMPFQIYKKRKTDSLEDFLFIQGMFDLFQLDYLWPRIRKHNVSRQTCTCTLDTPRFSGFYVAPTNKTFDECPVMHRWRKLKIDTQIFSIQEINVWFF